MESIYPSLESIWVLCLLITNMMQWKWCCLTSKERLEKVPQLPLIARTFSFVVIWSPTITWLPCSEKAKHIKRPQEHWSTAQLRSQANQQSLLPDMWLPHAPLDDVTFSHMVTPTPTPSPELCQPRPRHCGIVDPTPHHALNSWCKESVSNIEKRSALWRGSLWVKS